MKNHYQNLRSEKSIFYRLILQAVVCAFFLTASASSPLTATLSVTNVSCYNGYDGMIVVHATGGRPPYQYALNAVGNNTQGFQSSDTFSSLNPGPYVVTVSDAAGTSLTFHTTITTPAQIYIRDSIVNATGGLNNGAIYTTVSGGTPPYRYNWYNGDTTPASIGLAPQQYGYGLNVYDSLGCSNGVSQITIDTGSSALRFSYSSVHVHGCYPTQYFDLQIALSGGVGPYSASLDGGPPETLSSGSHNYYHLTGATHTFGIRDAHNTTLTVLDTFAMVATAPLTETIQVTQASGGNNNGSVIATATGGTPPYVFNISNPTFNNLAPGQYGVNVRDTNNCYTSLLAVIVDTTLNPPLTTTFTTTSIDCGGNGANATVTPSGGVPPYWEDIDSNGYNQGIPYFYGLAAGPHTVHIRDATGTVFSLPVIVPGDNLQVTGTVTNASNNLNNGSVVLNITPGVAPYTINWSDNTTNPFDTALAVGTSLNVNITDSLGCSAYAEFQIDSGRLTASAVVTQPTSCSYGGLVSITVTGGTWPYTDGNGNQYNPSYDFSGLAAGTYTFLVIDALHDTVRVTSTIGTAPAPLAGTFSTTAAGGTNANGTITTHVTGGVAPYHYQWSFTGTDAASLTGVPAGNYYVNITDTTGCSISLYNVNVYDTTGQPLTAFTYGNPNSACDTSTGNIEVDPYGGTPPYRISIGGPYDTTGNNYDYFYGLNPGIYPLTILDAAGDTFRSSITLAGIPRIASIVVTGTITDPTNNLDNGSITVHVSGGTPPYTYYWSNFPYRSNTLSGLTPGQYSVNVGDSNGCGQNVTFILDSGSSALAAHATVYNSACLGHGYIGVNATGGTQPYVYQIDGGGYISQNSFSGEFENLAAGPHVINVKDASGAVITLHDTIAAQTDHFLPTGTVTNATTSGSSNGAIALSSNGAVGPLIVSWYSIFTHTTSVTGLTPGAYKVQVSDSLGCGSDAVFVVGFGSATLSATATATDVSCYGDSTGTITVLGNSAQQPLLYRLGTGTPQTGNVFSHLPAGTYTVTVIDASTATTTVTVTIHQPLAPLSVTYTQNNANGTAPTGALSISVSGGTAPYTAAWGDVPLHSIVRTPIYQGTYDLGVADAAGCFAELIFTVDSTVLARVSSSTNVVCSGDSSGSIHVSATGGSPAYLYKLGNGSYQTDSVFTHLPAGTYTITVRAIGNDSSVVNETITQHTAIVANGAVTNTTGGQNNGAITLTVSGGAQPYSFNWGGGVTSQNRTGLAAGNYTVSVTDSAGCQKVETFTVTVIGINDPTADGLGITIYPNPNNGTFIIHSAVGAEVSLVNELGQKISSITLVADVPYQFANDTLPSGVYYMVSNDQQHLLRSKIVVVR